MNENGKKKISTEQNKDWKARVTIFLYSKLYRHYRNILFSYSICIHTVTESIYCTELTLSLRLLNVDVVSNQHRPRLC